MADYISGYAWIKGNGPGQSKGLLVFTILILLAPALSRAQVPQIEAVPDRLPTVIRQELEQQSQDLMAKKSAIKAKVVNHNQRCNGVPAESPLVGECRQAMSNLQSEIVSYTSDVKRFNDSIHSALKHQEEMAQAHLGNTNRIPIGAAGRVSGEVLVMQPNGAWKQMQNGDIFKSGDDVRTGQSGRVQILLLDETVFTIGSDTELTLDKFVYDPFTETGTFLASLAKGAIKFVSGKIAAKTPINMKIKTPVGTIGTRGTEFITEHNPINNISTHYLHEGGLEITPLAAGKTIVFSAGHIIVIDEGGISEVLPLSEQKWKMLEEKARLGSVR